MMHSSHEVRHRGGHSPNDTGSQQPMSPSLAIDVRSTGGGAGNNGNADNDSVRRKGHGRRRRDDLLRSNRCLLVVGGALAMLGVCLMGMWASSTSINKRGNPRQMDQHPGNGRRDRHPPHKKDGKVNKRPRVPGYQRDEEERFPIPKVRDDEMQIQKQRMEDEKRRKADRQGGAPDQPREQKTLVYNKGGRWKEEGAPNIAVEKEESEEGSRDGSPETEKVQEDDSEGSKGSPENIAPKDDSGGSNKSGKAHQKEGHLLTEDENNEKEDSEEGRKSRHFKKSADADDEDRANDASRSEEELSGGKKKKKVEAAAEVGVDTMPLARPVVGEMTRELHPRVLRLQLQKLPYKTTKARGGKPEIHRRATLAGVQRLPIHERSTIPSSDRRVTLYPDDDRWEDQVQNVKQSKKYRHSEREALEDEDCKPRHEWQRGAFPNCNVIHEYELGQLSGMYGRAVRKKLNKREGEGDELVKYLAHGYWRDVWLVSKTSGSFDTEYDGESEFDEEITVLKTLRFRHDFTDRNYDRHRKDALASERLSGSDSVIDIFAFCSNSAVYEYGKGGDIEGKLWPYDDEEEKYYVADISSLEKIEIAYQVAVGIADMHDVEEDGIASIAHTDITPSQFIFINGKWKMNDFNRCRFMRVRKDDGGICGFHVGANPGKFRAPEEYAYDEEDEMIDVYSMGNIFYTMLAGEMPFEGQKESKAQKKVMDGVRPRIPKEVQESEDPAMRAMVSATKQCWRQKPGDRPRAAKIRDFLKETMDRIKEDKTKEE